MERNRILLWAASSVLFLSACDNYVAFAPPTEDPQTTPAQELLPNAQPPTEFTKADVTRDDTLNLPDSVVLILPKLCVERKDGTVCDCQVDVHLRLLTSKKDILLFGKPTVSGSDLLETGGQAMLTILHRGDTLQLRRGMNFTLKIPTKLTNAARDRMLHFWDNPRLDTWQVYGPLAQRTREYYTLESDQLDVWQSPAYVHTAGSPNVTVALNPSGLAADPNTTRVFLVPTQTHSVVNTVRLGSGFVSTGRLPLGQEATVVVLGKRGDTVLLGMQKTTVQRSVNVTVELEAVEYQELNEKLATLR